MNASPASGTGSRSEGNNARPFFYAQPTTQPPFPNAWYLNPVYSPYCVSPAGFRNGNPYIPYYSVALREYPGFFLPQAPVPTQVNRRPYFHPRPPFPMFQHAARFFHYNSPGKKTETKETQTDPQKPERKSKKQQDFDASGFNTGSITNRMTNVATGKKAAVLSSLVQEREVHNKSPSTATTVCRIPPGSYALEKEEVRIEYGDGSPAIQLWKSFKETIPIYDLTQGETAPENIVQCDLFSVSSCERRGVVYTPHKGEEIPTVEYPEDKAGAMLTKQYFEAVQDKDIQLPGPNLEGSLDIDKEYIASQKCSNPLYPASQWQPDELNKSSKKVHSMANPSLSALKTPNRSTQELKQQMEPVCSGMEVINGLSHEPPIPNRYNGQSKLRDSFCSNKLGEFIPSPTWLARFEKIDASILPLPQRKSSSVSSVEASSKSEESSMDDVPMTDYVLEKNMYVKSTEGTEKEAEIQDDYYDDDEEEAVMMVDEADGIVVSDNKENSNGKLTEPIKRAREEEDPSRFPIQKTCLFKKKRECLSDPDSEVFWGIEDEDDVDYGKNLNEVEYIFEAVDPQEDLTPSNEGFYQKIGHRVIWKSPHTNTYPQLIVWPIKNKSKAKSGAYERTALFHKPKDRDYYETAYGELLKRQVVVKRKGRLQKETLMMTGDDFWVKSGAKPKFMISQNMSSTFRSKEQVKLDRPKRKMLHKYKNVRPEAETVEVWTVPKCSIHRGYGLRKSSHRK